MAKVDAEKQKGIAEVLGIQAFPSVFGMKDGIILDNFVGGLPQDEVQSNFPPKSIFLPLYNMRRSIFLACSDTWYQYDVIQN